MKIFEIVYADGEKQWVAADTNIEALREVISTEDTDLDLMEEIRDLPENKWDEMNVVNNEYDEESEEDEENWETKTFREFIKGYKSSVIISSTFYDA